MAVVKPPNDDRHEELVEPGRGRRVRGQGQRLVLGKLLASWDGGHGLVARSPCSTAALSGLRWPPTSSGGRAEMAYGCPELESILLPP